MNLTKNVKSTHDYEPYGVELLPMGANGETNNPYERYKFTGHERDANTGLDNMHFRYYSSTMGRFMKPDNILGNLSNPQSFNRYCYVKGNPVNYNDPSGHALNPPHSTDVAYMQGTHSFGMTWFDQFRDSWSPWVGQTPENSLYWHVPGVGLPPAGVDYGPAAIAPQDKVKLQQAANASDPRSAPLPEGWSIFKMTSDANSGFQAVLFYNSQTNQYVLAFAGSNGAMDYRQVFELAIMGHCPQLDRATKFTKEALNISGVSGNLSLIGHFLGGGLAAAIACRYGLPADNVGHLEGVGKVYMQAVVDTYGSYAFAYLHTGKLPEHAVAVLYNDVLAQYEEWGLTPLCLRITVANTAALKAIPMNSSLNSMKSGTARRRCGTPGPTGLWNALTAPSLTSSSGRSSAKNFTNRLMLFRKTLTYGLDTTITNVHIKVTEPWKKTR